MVTQLTCAPQSQTRRAKAFELIQSGWPSHLPQPKYEPDHALVLCRLHGFKEGLVFLYDKLRLFREVVQVGGGKSRVPVNQGAKIQDNTKPLALLK